MVWGTGASAADSDPEQNPDPGNILFQSVWDYTTGTGRDAVEDGGFGAREWYRLCSTTSNIAEVVTGSTAGWTLTNNVLAVTKHGTNCTQMITSTDGGSSRGVSGLSDRQSHYIRMYIRADLTQAENWANHPICSPTQGQIECRHWAPRDVNDGANTYRHQIFCDGAVDADDLRWSSSTISTDTWYRFEWFIEFYDATNPNRYRVWPRIYTMAGALLKDSDDYVRSTGWVGDESAVETLTEWYTSGGYFSWDAAAVSNEFGVGYEGPAGASDTGEVVYMAAVAVGTAGWLGAYA